MLISLAIQSLSLMISLIWLYVNLSGPGVDELLHFLIISINSFLAKEFYSSVGLLEISSKMWISISLVWAELKKLCRAIQRSLSSIHECPSYWIASITESFHFLIQFISFHGPHFLFAISYILSSKKRHFVFLTVLLKLCQFSRLWYAWYLSRDSQHSLFHHTLEFLCHNSSTLDASRWTISLRISAFGMENVFKFLIIRMMSSMNCFSLLFPFASKHYKSNILFSWMDTSIVIRVWSDNILQSGWIWYWLNSREDGQRNTKSKIELALWSLSEYLVGTYSIGLEILREKESEISKRELL